MQPSPLSGKKIAILGCGYLGDWLMEECLLRDMNVAVLTRNAVVCQRLGMDPRVKVIQANLEEESWHSSLADPYDFVVNCVSSGGKGLEGYQKSYRDGMKSLCRWASSNPPGHIIYTSSSGIYLQSEGQWVDETMGPPADNCPPGTQLLLESEKILREAFPKKSTVLRLSGIYGPGRHLLLDRILNGDSEIPGNPDIWLNLIHVRDAISAIFTCMLQPHNVTGTFNICDDHPSSRGEIIEFLAQHLNRKAPTFDPSRQVRRSPFPDGKVPHRRVSNKKFSTTTGWKPGYPSFRQGYQRLIHRILTYHQHTPLKSP